MPASKTLPARDFYLFGMGARRKLVYAGGALRDACSGQPVLSWEVAGEEIRPQDYEVRLTTRAGGAVRLYEDESALWVEEDGRKRALSSAPVALPDFAGHAHAETLRVLHADILTNITPAGPVPCLFVYCRPWYRDAAMMAMVLERTGNLGLIREWILALRSPYDRNNAGNAEPDNLGQLLYLVSLAADQRHPLVGAVLREAERRREGSHLAGLTDGGAKPVYQTKWLKFGLRKLGLEDRWEIPRVADPYSQLFWWDYTDRHVATEPFSARQRDLYPYLGWAADHFHKVEPAGPFGDRAYPLTWEQEASEANYAGMRPVSEEYERLHLSAPHTWHAAEMFLYLLGRG
jgi:hypothetical protein